MLDINTIFWGGLCRVVQAAAQAAPTLLCGLLLASVFRRLIGPDNIRKLFGSYAWQSVARAWAMGVVLPVCALGVLPIVRQLRRAGIQTGTILAFALAAPLFNPVSLLYGLSLSTPGVILAFVAASLVVVICLGLAWNRLCPGLAACETPEPRAESGWKRVAAVTVTASRDAAGPTMVYCLVGLAGMGLLGGLLPHGCLQRTMNHSNPWAPLVMTAIAPWIYVTPTNAMMQVGSMFIHGNSVGAAFALLTIGSGVSAGLLAWSWHTIGLRRTLVWFISLELVVLALAYAGEKPLFPAGLVEQDHTHVFDSYTSPYLPGSPGLATATWAKLRCDIRADEWLGLKLLLGLSVLGLGLRLWDPREKVEAYLLREADPAAGPRRTFDWRLPTPVVGASVVALVVVASVVACYIVYPDAQEVLADMRIVRADALCAAHCGEKKEARDQLDVWDDLTRKLEIGVYLRQGWLTADKAAASRGLRHDLDLLDDALDRGSRAKVKAALPQVEAAYAKCRDAYLTNDCTAAR